MKVFVTGANGYIGGAIADKLKAEGHEVVGLTHSDEGVQKLQTRGIQAVKGSLTDAAVLAKAASEADGVIHTATTNDANAPQVDKAAVDTIIEALAGSNKPFIWTGGIWAFGDTGQTIADENTPNNPTPLVAWRPAARQHVLDAASRGIRTIAIEPAIVYGKGMGILNFVMLQPARQAGVVRYIGNGHNHWPFVHVDDLAELYIHALEKGQPGSMYFGVTGKSYQVQEIAEAINRSLGKEGKIEAWPLSEAQKAMGLFADALVLDQKASGAKAMRELGWQPKAPSVLEELEHGSYKA